MGLSFLISSVKGLTCCLQLWLFRAVRLPSGKVGWYEVLRVGGREAPFTLEETGELWQQTCALSSSQLVDGTLLVCAGPSGFLGKAEVEDADCFGVACRCVVCREVGLGRSGAKLC